MKFLILIWPQPPHNLLQSSLKMPPRNTNYDMHRDIIVSEYLKHPASAVQALNVLKKKHGIHMSKPTLYRRLDEWGVQLNKEVKEDTALDEKIQILFTQMQMSDKKILKLLEDWGFQISKKQLRSIRRKLGLRRRTSKAQFEKIEDQIKQEVQIELNKIQVEMFGRQHLHSYFWKQGMFISRYLPPESAS